MYSPINISGRFCGPPDSANGGYTCGLLAKGVKGAAEVTLRHPPPINRDLEIKQTAENCFALYDQSKIIAEAKPAELELVPPDPLNLETAKRATIKEEDITDHYFPECFVCGPRRRPGDGLRIFPGPVEGKDYIAAVWLPDKTLSDEQGYIKDEFIWSALDCPSGWAIITEKMRFIMLGRLVVEIDGSVKSNTEFIVIGWKLSEEGRKIYAGTALYSVEGQLLAKGKATWIEFR